MFWEVEGGFDFRFVVCGGEDFDFFWCCIRCGVCFVWCDNVVVYEIVLEVCMKCVWFLVCVYCGG